MAGEYRVNVYDSEDREEVVARVRYNVVTADRALNAILKSGNTELLDTKKFKGLKELAQQKGLLDSEETDEEQ